MGIDVCFLLLIYIFFKDGENSMAGELYSYYLQQRMPLWYLILDCQNRVTLSPGLDS